MIYKDFLNVEPYDYQKEGANFALSSHYCLIADEMGLGKTLQALIVAFLEGLKGEKTLIVVPAFLRLNWEMEIIKFSKWYHMLHLVEKKAEIADFDPRFCIAIICYAAIEESESLCEWADIVIADEAHYLKEITSRRTLKFHQYVYENTPERLMLLTGTPIPNGVVEFYSLLLLLSYTLKPTNGLKIDKAFPTPESFYRTFAYEVNYTVRVKGGSRAITRYEGLKNIDELKMYLKDKYIRRKCKDVLNLPPLLQTNIIADYHNNPKLWKAFKEFNEENKASDPTIKAKSALLKAPFTAKYAQNLIDSHQGPVLVYTDHIKSCELIAETLKCPHIKGDIPMAKRNELVGQFQAGELDALVITIGAGAEGMNLTRATNLIFNDFNWVPTKNEQVRKRFHRIGQTKRCTVHNIIGSVQDEKIIKNLLKKMKVIEEII